MIELITIFMLSLDSKFFELINFFIAPLFAQLSDTLSSKFIQFC